MTSLNQRLISLESNAGTTTGTSGTITIADVENLETTLETKQDKLTAGDNINIVGNVISATGGGGGTTIDTTTDISCKTITTVGNANIGGIISAPNQVRFKASRLEGFGVLTFGTVNGTIPFNKTITNIGGGYNSTTSTFTAPVAGTYFIYAQIFTNSGATYAADFHSGNDIIYPMRRSAAADGGDSTIHGAFYHTLNVGETVYLKLLGGSVKITFDPITFFGGYLLS